MRAIRHVASFGVVMLLVVASAAEASAGRSSIDGRSAGGQDSADDPVVAPVQGRVDPAFWPVGLRDAKPVLVIVKMSGDPVAVEQGRAPGRHLSDARKAQIKQDLRRRQDAARPDIAARGGRVLTQFQVAYNGLKVEIARDRVASLESIPGVVDVVPVDVFEPTNATSVPYIGAPGVWQDVGLRGEGVKVAVLDTGVDYTHADFGGPGTPEAFAAADATDTAPPDPALFGPAASKVKGGTDLVGDDYNSSSDDPAERIPHPDPNPLDCAGHGSHVAGTAVGFGVLSDGTTFTGPYDSSTYANSFEVGPGVAPLADLYPVRVFGCEGSTNVVLEAIDWAVDNDMDVVNMSLGSSFGRPDGSSAEASNNAALAGVVVVASAGNSGPVPYITGSPATATRAISVAAVDSVASFPGATLALSTGQSLTAINANAATFADGTTFPVVVLRNPDNSVSLGCDEAEYDDALVAGKLVVTRRGVCARIDRAIFGQRHGAGAVAMINNAPGYPPFEGPIFDPDTGDPVTIPFLGVQGAPSPDGGNLVAADGGTATATNSTVPNPTFTGLADFTSAGPRNSDSFLKPDISAPGVSIQSAAVGTGTGGFPASGTSMAAPHVAGVAALTRQAHPGWDTEDVKAAIVNTGNPSAIGGTSPYRASRGGSGLVQPQGSTATSVVAVGDPGTASLNFGFAELGADFAGTKALALRNHGLSDVTLSVAAGATAGSRPHSATPSASTVTVPAGGTATVALALNVPATTAGDSAAFREVAGLVTLTPASGQNGDVALRAPYYLVPRALSKVTTTLDGSLNPGHPTQTATLTNPGGVVGATARVYAWGLEDRNEGLEWNDVRAVGVRGRDIAGVGRVVEFAVNAHHRWSNASVSEYDILLDVNDDGTDDYAVAGVDFGLVTAGFFNGQMGAFVVNLATNEISITFLGTAPTDSSTILLPVRAVDIGLSPANPRFRYSAAAFSLFGRGDDAVVGKAKFNAFQPAVAATPSALSVAPNASATTSLAIDPTEWMITAPRGLMVATIDNASGAGEAQLIRLPTK